MSQQRRAGGCCPGGGAGLALHRSSGLVSGAASSSPNERRDATSTGTGGAENLAAAKRHVDLQRGLELLVHVQAIANQGVGQGASCDFPALLQRLAGAVSELQQVVSSVDSDPSPLGAKRPRTQADAPAAPLVRLPSQLHTEPATTRSCCSRSQPVAPTSGLGHAPGPQEPGQSGVKGDALPQPPTSLLDVLHMVPGPELRAQLLSRLSRQGVRALRATCRATDQLLLGLATGITAFPDGEGENEGEEELQQQHAGAGGEGHLSSASTGGGVGSGSTSVLRRMEALADERVRAAMRPWADSDCTRAEFEACCVPRSPELRVRPHPALQRVEWHTRLRPHTAAMLHQLLLGAPGLRRLCYQQADSPALELLSLSGGNATGAGGAGGLVDTSHVNGGDGGDGGGSGSGSSSSDQQLRLLGMALQGAGQLEEMELRIYSEALRRLDAQCLLAAVQQLSGLRSLELLDHSGQDGSEGEGALALASGISSLTQLRALRLGKMFAGAAATAAAGGLADLGQLTQLHVMGSGWGEAAVGALSNSLSGHQLPRLQDLQLWQCDVGQPAAEQLASALQYNTQLTRLDMGWLSYGPPPGDHPAVFRTLAESLPSRSLRVLHITHASIGDAGIIALCGPTGSHPPNPSASARVSASGGAGGGLGGAGSTGSAGRSGSGASGSAAAFGGPLSRMVLQELSLYDNRITVAGAAVLSTFMVTVPAFSSRLTKLDLGANTIGDAGLQALLPGLPPSLHGLHLCCAGITDESVPPLVRLLGRTPLEMLYLMGNDVSEAGQAALRAAFPHQQPGCCDTGMELDGLPD